MALVDMVEVRRMPANVVDDERALRRDQLSLRDNVVESRFGECASDAVALPPRIDLGMGEDNSVVIEEVRRQTGKVSVDSHLISPRRGVVRDDDVRLARAGRRLRHDSMMGQPLPRSLADAINGGAVAPAHGWVNG
jgi:hypothetical protein